jgi:hypothetical protein
MRRDAKEMYMKYSTITAALSACAVLSCSTDTADPISAAPERHLSLKSLSLRTLKSYKEGECLTGIEVTGCGFLSEPQFTLDGEPLVVNAYTDSTAQLFYHSFPEEGTLQLKVDNGKRVDSLTLFYRDSMVIHAEEEVHCSTCNRPLFI